MTKEDETAPSWDGDVAGFDPYTIKVTLYVRGAQKDEKGLCGPRLMSKPQDRVWQGVQKYDKLDTPDMWMPRQWTP
eukprot:7916284-Pyramimonas_sp.AAC.1